MGRTLAVHTIRLVLTISGGLRYRVICFLPLSVPTVIADFSLSPLYTTQSGPIILNWFEKDFALLPLRGAAHLRVSRAHTLNNHQSRPQTWSLPPLPVCELIIVGKSPRGKGPKAFAEGCWLIYYDVFMNELI